MVNLFSSWKAFVLLNFVCKFSVSIGSISFSDKFCRGRYSETGMWFLGIWIARTCLRGLVNIGNEVLILLFIAHLVVAAAECPCKHFVLIVGNSGFSFVTCMNCLNLIRLLGNGSGLYYVEYDYRQPWACFSSWCILFATVGGSLAH